MDKEGNYDVRIISGIAAQATAVVRTRVRLSELAVVVPRGCGEAWEYARSAGLPRPGHNIALYRDGAEGEVAVEAGAEMAVAIEGNGHVIASFLPAGRVATTPHFGPYDRLGEAHAAIRAYCTEHRLSLAGTSWERYGHWTDNPGELRTDVFYLLEP